MSFVNGRGRAVAIPAFVCTALAAAAAGLAQLRPEDPLAPVIGRLPQATAMVIVSPHPTHVLEQLKIPWRRLGPLAGGLASPALEGWAMLTKELGYGPQEGFNALTSGGVAIVLGPPKGAPGDGRGEVKIEGGDGQALKATIEDEPHWAVASVVKAATAANLRQRLRAAPHGVVGGVPVLSVEDGRFALVCKPLSKDADADELLVLAPMDDRGYFDSVVAAVEPAKAADGAAAPTLAAAPAFALAQKTTADILIVAAERAGRSNEPDWTRGRVISCTLAQRLWTVQSDSASAPGKAGPTGRLPAEASAWFEQWSPRAAAMVVGSGFRQMVEAVEADAPADAVQDGTFAQIRRLKGVEAAGVFIGPAVAQPAAKDAAPPSLSVWAALRVRERRLLENGELDLAGCAVASAFERGLRSVFSGRPDGEGPASGAPDPATFSALPAGTARVVTVKLSPGDLLSGNATDAVPGTVTWARTPTPAHGSGPADPDWAVLGVEPSGEFDLVADRQRSLAALLSGPAPVGAADGKDWVWRGVLRPRVVLRSLPMPIGFALGVAGVGSLGEVRFEEWNEGGEQHARLVIDWDEKDAKP